MLWVVRTQETRPIPLMLAGFARRGFAAFVRILWQRTTFGSKVDFTCDIDGRPFRAYVRGPRSKPKPSTAAIERELKKAQAKWDAANR
jgi:hypothetical protein